MTIVELMKWDGKTSLEEYQKRLNTKKKLERSIGIVSDHIMWEEDALELLSDEADGERYQRHLERYQRLYNKRNKLMKQLERLEV